MAEKPEKIEETKRYIHLSGEINEQLSKEFINSLLKLELDKPSEDILIIINSFGGSIHALWSIIDCINLCRCRVHTLCLGKAMSAGAIILMSGAKGCRYIAPNANVMLHKIQSGNSGDFDTVQNQVRELERLQKQLDSYIASRTRIKKSEVETILSRELYLSPEDALKKGIVDRIIKSFSEIDIKKW
jgi:ATP-dependent Clp protease protease subunit